MSDGIKLSYVMVEYKGEMLRLERVNGKAWLKRFVPEHNFWATTKKYNERSAKKLGI